MVFIVSKRCVIKIFLSLYAYIYMAYDTHIYPLLNVGMCLEHTHTHTHTHKLDSMHAYIHTYTLSHMTLTSVHFWTAGFASTKAITCSWVESTGTSIVARTCAHIIHVNMSNSWEFICLLKYIHVSLYVWINGYFDGSSHLCTYHMCKHGVCMVFMCILC